MLLAATSVKYAHSDVRLDASFLVQYQRIDNPGNRKVFTALLQLTVYFQLNAQVLDFWWSSFNKALGLPQPSLLQKE